MALSLQFPQICLPVLVCICKMIRSSEIKTSFHSYASRLFTLIIVNLVIYFESDNFTNTGQLCYKEHLHGCFGWCFPMSGICCPFSFDIHYYHRHPCYQVVHEISMLYCKAYQSWLFHWNIICQIFPPRNCCFHFFNIVGLTFFFVFVYNFFNGGKPSFHHQNVFTCMSN